MHYTQPLTSHYQHRIGVWRDIFSGVDAMDNDTLRLLGRLALAFSFIGLVLTGHVAGGVGVTAATITGGLDLPAALQAYSEIKSDDQAESDQTKFG